ncbi:MULTISPECIES: antitoxin Xre/MbcA/ParS toxin-binding domain-containing protein [Sphingomonas]|jgi:hypothetical protein|uniref:Antitoxin Xre/MbcA/ParS-like toxin-binding domain-containing protein n=1 Tax=Sphingomonas kyeonggiensis TaxID=1268553 RepID=A0A7W7K4X9_9SPHN|nr:MULTISPECIES: antitoxin Xre/MbcA/ParS toxin-binding domain-containing protein [Sphingomonas]MBB4840703.1 hypothetical protein [Sphingomonas kyeonggiensis]WHU01007.1 DUF2384 domain-containing protein [Sphingomonas sp. NIBR02145]
MSEASVPASTPEERPQTRPFRRQFTAARLDPQSAERQGRAARIAFEALGREEATLFLNGHDAALGGRPLDLAVASAEGLAAVEQAIAARKAAPC